MKSQLDLPGQAHVAEGPIDHSGMYVMHYAFRRDMADLATATERTAATDRGTWRAIARYWALFAELLHHHHTAEDDHYWPVLAEAVAVRGDDADRAVIAAMEDEHAAIDPALDACGRGFHRMLTDPTEEDAAQLHADLVLLQLLVDEHLAHEERETLPLVQRMVDPAVYAEVEKAIGRSYPLRLIGHLVPWAFYGLPAAHASQVMAEAPLPHRVLLRLTRGRFARRHRTAFGRATGVGS